MNNVDDILKLLNALAALPFDNVEVITPEATVRVSIGRATAPVVLPAAQEKLPEPQPPEPSDKGRLVVIPSPIIGVFYSSPSPEDEPYVKVGDRVAVGQTLCVIEAMKLMNEVPSPVAGTIRQLIAHNSTDVEVGQALFGIEPAEGAK